MPSRATPRATIRCHAAFAAGCTLIRRLCRLRLESFYTRRIDRGRRWFTCIERARHRRRRKMFDVITKRVCAMIVDDGCCHAITPHLRAPNERRECSSHHERRRSRDAATPIKMLPHAPRQHLMRWRRYEMQSRRAVLPVLYSEAARA